MEIQISGIYWLTTNAPADKEPVKTNQGNVYMDHKFRPTVVLEQLHQIGNETIYLIAQFSSNPPKVEDNLAYVNVDDYLSSSEELELHGFVLPINVRMALSSEFSKNPVNEENKLELIPSNKFSEFKQKCLDLIKGMKREGVINDTVSGKFDNYDENQLKELIDFTQFNQPEREVKGFYGAYNDKRNKRNK